MSVSLEAFRSFSSANTWLELIDAPLPSPVCRAIVDALSGAPASAEVLEVWRSISTHAYPTSLAARAIVEEGRGALKSTELVIVVIDRLLRFDAGPFVAPGSEVVGLVCAPTVKQAAGAIRNALPIAAKVAELLGGRANVRAAADATEVTFEIPGLSYVPKLVVGAADEATIRGAAVVAVAFDEAAWFPSGPRALNTLADLVVAATPRAMQFPHSLIAYGSTNGVPAGMFYELVQKPPPGHVMIGPVASWLANPNIDEARVRAENPPDLVSQEFECLTWGLRDSPFIPAGPAMASVDEDATYTPKGLGRIKGALVGFDKGGVVDEIGYVLGYRVDVEVAPGKHVAHLVVEHAESWRPGAKKPTSAEQADRAGRLSIAAGGCPVLADVSGFIDVADHLVKQLGFKVSDASTDEEREAWIRRGGKFVAQQRMDPETQTRRWQRLRDLVIGGRLHLPDTEGGRELARQLTTLRATQLRSKALRVDAQSGSEDGLADCLSYIAGFLDLLPATRADGARREFVQRRPPHYDHLLGVLPAEGEYHLIGPDGQELGRCGPDPSDPAFPRYYLEQRSQDVSASPEIDAFVRARLGLSESEPITFTHHERLKADLAASGEVPAAHVTFCAVLQEQQDPLWRAKRENRFPRW